MIELNIVECLSPTSSVGEGVFKCLVVPLNNLLLRSTVWMLSICSKLVGAEILDKVFECLVLPLNCSLFRVGFSSVRVFISPPMRFEI